MDRLDALPEDWDRALAIAAHPDDLEYGAASAVARWTATGKDVRYLLVTRGEAGIESMPPGEVGPIREAEQRRGCAAVGVSEVEFLDHADGLVEDGLALRADLAAAIRRHRPDVVITCNHHDSWGGPSWNHADHRAVGRATLDAVRAAANPWILTDRGEPWNGVRFVAVSASPRATHAVDVTDHLAAGVDSLRCHELYLGHLDDPPDPYDLLHGAAAATGPRLGVELAVAFEVVYA